MAKECTDCKTPSKNVIAETEEKSFELTYEPTETSILTIRGAKESIAQPLVTSYGQPRGGWYANVTVQGVRHRINGNTAFKVFTTLKNMLQVNGVSIPQATIWFNLNLQWYSRLPEKYMLVRYKALLALVAKDSSPKVVTNTADRNYSPTQWGKTAWDFMSVFLAQDDYHWDQFFEVLNIVRGMMNNDVNPSIGCNECYIEFTKQIDMLRSNPIYNVKDARLWLVNFHNSVNKRLNKPITSYEQAAKLHLWT